MGGFSFEQASVKNTAKHFTCCQPQHWCPYSQLINRQDEGHQGIDWLIKANVLLICRAALLSVEGKVKQHVLFTGSGSLVDFCCRLQADCDNSVIAVKQSFSHILHRVIQQRGVLLSLAVCSLLINLRNNKDLWFLYVRSFTFLFLSLFLFCFIHTATWRWLHWQYS